MSAVKRWICRFRILLIRQLRSPSFWVVAALMLLLQFYISSVSLPTAMNRAVGLYQGSGVLAGKVVEDLLETKSSYKWTLYDSTEALADAVRTGEVDCGFALDEKLDAAAEKAASSLETPDLKGCVDYYYTTSSTKGASAKESVFAGVLGAVSPVILDSAVASGAIFQDAGPDVREQVQKNLETVLSGDALLTVHFEVYGGSEDENMDRETAAASPAMNAGGLAGILLFLSALLFAAARFRSDSARVSAYFRRGRALYRSLEIFAPLLVTGLIIAVLLLAGHKTGIAQVLLLVPVLFLSSVWCAGFVRFFRHEGVYLFFSTGLTVVSAVLCSSAGSLFLLNSVRWLKFLLPAYWIQAVLML